MDRWSLRLSSSRESSPARLWGLNWSVVIESGKEPIEPASEDRGTALRQGSHAEKESMRGRALPAGERRFDSAAQTTCKRQRDPLRPLNWAVTKYGLLSRLARSKLKKEREANFL